MTYTVIGRCPRTNQIGIGVATYSIACGSFTQGAQSAHGVAMTQANVRKGNSPLANALLAQGFSSRSVLQILVDDDAQSAWRQTGVMTRDGRVSVYTGDKVRSWCGQRDAQDFLVFGNGLAGEHVLVAMETGFNADVEAPLAERLLQSLEHGRDAGGQGFNSPKKPERSACLVVTGQRHCAEWALRVDIHPQAVEELRRVYHAFQPYQPFYNERHTRPDLCLAQDAWERANLRTPA